MSTIVDPRSARLEGPSGTFVINPGSVLSVGRGRGSDLLIKDGSVSRAHAQIKWARAALAPSVEDLDSANGIAIDGARTKQGALKDGGEVCFGSVGFRVRLIGCGDSTAAAPDDSADGCAGLAGILSADGAGVGLLLSLEAEGRTGVLEIGEVHLVLFKGLVAVNRDSASAEHDLVRVVTSAPKGSYFRYGWRRRGGVPDSVRLVSPGSLLGVSQV